MVSAWDPSKTTWRPVLPDWVISPPTHPSFFNDNNPDASEPATTDLSAVMEKCNSAYDCISQDDLLTHPPTRRDVDNHMWVGAHANVMDVALGDPATDIVDADDSTSKGMSALEVGGIVVLVLCVFVALVSSLWCRSRRGKKAVRARKERANERSFTEVFGSAGEVEMQAVTVSERAKTEKERDPPPAYVA